MSWSARNESSKKKKWLVVTGRAYPRIHPGKNTTDQATSSEYNREAFYNDPAIVLSDADMNAHNGAEGMPLCVEHNQNDVVGHVHHSFFGDGDQRALKIIAHIDTSTRRGEQIANQVQAGKYKGLSVGYLADINHSGHVRGKKFREISLVEEPFFDGCDLAPMRVMASKEGISNQTYIDGETKHIYISIESSMSMSSDQPAATEQQPPAVTPNELLSQTDSLKTQFNDVIQQNDQLKQQNEQLKAIARLHTEQHVAEWKPKLDEHLKWLAGTRPNGAIPQEEADSITKTFLNPMYKEFAQNELYKRDAAITASKKAQDAEARIKDLQDRLDKMSSAAAVTSHVINNSRKELAQAVHVETERKVIGASKTPMHLNEIMCPEPCADDIPMLRAFGYLPEPGSVNASRSGAPQLQKSVQAYPTNPQEYVNGEMTVPNSARYSDNPMFAFMFNHPEFVSGDLGSVVNLIASKNEVQRLEPAASKAE